MEDKLNLHLLMESDLTNSKMEDNLVFLLKVDIKLFGKHFFGNISISKNSFNVGLSELVG